MAPRYLLIFMCCVLLAACGRNQIRDLPPLVRLSQVELNQDTHVIKIRIENPNDVPFHAEQLSFALALGEHEMNYDGVAQVDIVPHSAEEIPVVINIPQTALDELEALTAGAGLNWAIEGIVPQQESREWPFRARGVIYAVPGVADIYRASASGSAYPIQRSR